MFSEIIQPRFSDTDALGHINNTMLPVWFEGARDAVFKLFTPDLDLNKWQLIIAKYDVTFHAELFYGQEIELRTYISRVGGASFDVYQEAWQHGEKCVSGTTVMVNFNYSDKKAMPISESIKIELNKHIYQE
ncbi:acyl-CoA thioesterase [Flocculibacter collagenilyticus]|uniref:acyl-CoA thioesterase n=1 Tax=Flocculibacter collagenilyticus TaxID=2744479 RepID=UPI0018F66EBA|nr:thioesterase family protein [Flocculibacter collagenilyticus]